jgi:CheY-like chemotaxis protein
MMPGMDGATTYKHLQANPHTREIPVVLLTAATNREGLEGISVISKPFDPLLLSSQLASALGWTPAQA